MKLGTDEVDKGEQYNEIGGNKCGEAATAAISDDDTRRELFSGTDKLKTFAVEVH